MMFLDLMLQERGPRRVTLLCGIAFLVRTEIRLKVFKDVLPCRVKLAFPRKSTRLDTYCH